MERSNSERKGVLVKRKTSEQGSALSTAESLSEDLVPFLPSQPLLEQVQQPASPGPSASQLLGLPPWLRPLLHRVGLCKQQNAAEGMDVVSEITS